MENADTYLDLVPEPRKSVLIKIRNLVLASSPDIDEGMQYKLPTYRIGNELVFAFANQKHYMALYIMHHDLLENFKEDLKAYNCGKSCIRFKKMDKDGYQLVERILNFVVKHMDQSTLYKDGK